MGLSAYLVCETEGVYLLSKVSADAPKHMKEYLLKQKKDPTEAPATSPPVTHRARNSLTTASAHGPKRSYSPRVTEHESTNTHSISKQQTQGNTTTASTATDSQPTTTTTTSTTTTASTTPASVTVVSSPSITPETAIVAIKVLENSAKLKQSNEKYRVYRLSKEQRLPENAAMLDSATLAQLPPQKLFTPPKPRKLPSSMFVHNLPLSYSRSVPKLNVKACMSSLTLPPSSPH